MPELYFLILLSFCLNASVYAQNRADRHWQQVPGKYFLQVTCKSHHFEKQVNKRSQKALDRLFRQEKKMQARLARIDSVAAKNIFTLSIDSMDNLQTRLKQKAGKYDPSKLGASYSGYMDTLQNSLSFLKDAKSFSGQSKALQDKVNGSLQSQICNISQTLYLYTKGQNQYRPFKSNP